MDKRKTFVFLWWSFAGLVHLSGQCVSGDCVNGSGTYLFPSGATYSGQFSAGKLNGHGTLIFSNGDRYEGQWANHYRDGRGTFIYRNGEKYTGEFKRNHFQGQGKFFYANGSVYQGAWNQSRRSGPGRLTSSNGEVQEGEWVNDQLKAEARITHSTPISSAAANTSNPTHPPAVTSTLANCNETFCHQMQGQYTYRDGTRFVGMFSGGQPTGDGICYYSNGDRYEGQWSNHAPNGIGSIYFQNGKVYKGKWRNGQLIERYSQDEVLTFASKPEKNYDPEVKIYALLVGVSAYNHMPTLRYTDDDAYRIFAFLKSPEGGALPDEQIRLLIDEDATRQNILREMQKVFYKADKNDMVVLYFSGHGLKGSLIPYDFDGLNNQLAYTDVQAILDRSEAKQKVCLVDACYAGSMQQPKNATISQSLNNFYTLINSATSGTAFLLSSAESEVSLEDNGLRQGVFSHFLIKGLKGEADENQDKMVQLGELFNYVTAEVKRYTLNRQSPYTAGRFDRAMPVAFIR